MCLFTALSDRLIAQCTPPMSEYCDEVSVLCSLDEVNGYACQNNSSVPSPCAPLCSQGGVGHNTSWWGFVSQGGNVTITLTIGGCTTSQGLQYGIWGDCNCSEEIACRSIPCVPPGSVEVINANLKACKTYYLWVDGCSGDICDFTLNNSGGGSPSLSPLGYINNQSNSIIDSVCVGACGYRLFVDPQPGTCSPHYVWTMDAQEVVGNSNEIKLNFPKVGDFKVCVSAYIGNVESGSICSKEGPRCATVKVRTLTERVGKDSLICFEKITADGFIWHNQKILTSGYYRQNFKDSSCCSFDSVIFFKLLPKPKPANVIHMGCHNEPYIDAMGRSWVGCKNKFEIPLPKLEVEHGCDSSILLTAIPLDLKANITHAYINDTLEYSPNVIVPNPCNVGETYSFTYRWRDVNDTLNTVLSTQEYFRPSKPGHFVVDVMVLCTLDSVKTLCSFSFDEQKDEMNLFKGPRITTQKEICLLDTTWVHGTFSFSDTALKYSWEVVGGQIISNPDSSSIRIAWSLNKGEQAFVSLKLVWNGFQSSLSICNIYSIQYNVLGKDFSVFAQSAKLKTNSFLNGTWTMISGPSTAILDDANSHTTDATVESFGTYCFEWRAQLPGCEERDTLCIHFKNLIVYDDPEKRKEERGDSLKRNLVLRKGDLSFLSNTGQYLILKSNNPMLGQPQAEFYDLQGKLITKAMPCYWISNQYLKIERPDCMGVIILKINFQSESKYYKVFLHQP